MAGIHTSTPTSAPRPRATCRPGLRCQNCGDGVYRDDTDAWSHRYGWRCRSVDTLAIPDRRALHQEPTGPWGDGTQWAQEETRP